MNDITPNWWGCTVTYLAGFPYDAGENSWITGKLASTIENLKIQTAKHVDYTRCWVAILCSQQKKAKTALEEIGFKTLVTTESGHSETPHENNCNGGTIYVMWKEVPHRNKLKEK